MTRLRAYHARCTGGPWDGQTRRLEVFVPMFTTSGADPHLHDVGRYVATHIVELDGDGVPLVEEVGYEWREAEGGPA